MSQKKRSSWSFIFCCWHINWIKRFESLLRLLSLTLIFFYHISLGLFFSVRNIIINQDVVNILNFFRAINQFEFSGIFCFGKFNCDVLTIVHLLLDSWIVSRIVTLSRERYIVVHHSPTLLVYSPNSTH